MKPEAIQAYLKHKKLVALIVVKCIFGDIKKCRKAKPDTWFQRFIISKAVPRRAHEEVRTSSTELLLLSSKHGSKSDRTRTAQIRNNRSFTVLRS